MGEPQPNPPELPVSPANPSWQTRLRAIFPFVITGLIAIVLSLLGQAILLAFQSVPASSNVDVTNVTQLTMTLETNPTDVSISPIALSPTPPVPDERILAQEVLDLQAEIDILKSDQYLVLAVLQLSDAENALKINNLDEVERSLETAGVALDRAYSYAEVYKTPIEDFRAQVGKLHEELRVYPEGIDQRLRRLRRDILSLVSEDD